MNGGRQIRNSSNAHFREFRIVKCLILFRRKSHFVNFIHTLRTFGFFQLSLQQVFISKFVHITLGAQKFQLEFKYAQITFDKCLPTTGSSRMDLNLKLLCVRNSRNFLKIHYNFEMNLNAWIVWLSVFRVKNETINYSLSFRDNYKWAQHGLICRRIISLLIAWIICSFNYTFQI